MKMPSVYTISARRHIPEDGIHHTLLFVYLASKRPLCKRFLHSKFVMSLASAHYNVLYSTNLIILHELYKLPASPKFTVSPSTPATSAQYRNVGHSVQRTRFSNEKWDKF
jgi:hypothetical protein